MTGEGFTVLDDELKRLKSSERPAVIAAISEARSHGDLSENAEYHAAKERQGWIEGRIAEIEDKISRAQVIDVSKLSGKAVKFGATVTVVDEDTEDESPLPDRRRARGGREAGPPVADQPARAHHDRQGAGRGGGGADARRHQVATKFSRSSGSSAGVIQPAPGSARPQDAPLPIWVVTDGRAGDRGAGPGTCRSRSPRSRPADITVNRAVRWRPWLAAAAEPAGSRGRALALDSLLPIRLRPLRGPTCWIGAGRAAVPVVDRRTAPLVRAAAPSWCSSRTRCGTRRAVRSRHSARARPPERS